MQPSYIENRSISLNVLSVSQREEIHSTVLAVLEEVGVVVKCSRALELLKSGGAFIEGEKVKLPRVMVERALRSAPSGFALYDQKGSSKLLFEGKHFNFGPGPSTTYTIDPYTLKRRRPCKQDTVNAVRVMDALENIDFVMDFGTVEDVPTRYADLYQLQAILENTTKPVVHWGFDAQNCHTIVDMCTAVTGSLEELQKKPFLALFSCSNTPLLHTVEALEKLIFTAEMNLPFVYVSAPTAGATTPVSLAGTMVVTLAECLSGLVIHQLVREGAPVALGVVAGATDMNTMAMSYGCPEFDLMHAALTEMVHHYGLPLWGTAGCTDSKAVDEQAALEATASIMMSAMSGTNMIHDVGYTEGGNCSNLAMLVMCDEIIGFTKRLIRGVRVDELTLALHTIREVGPMGEFVTAKHTYDNFKSELWFPKLCDRHSYQRWVADGSLTMGEKAMARARNLIENHNPETLESTISNKIEQIVVEASSK
ncbi:MAG: trimethylamine methyltransferase family protein [Firmicutes bacterium]|nr:trimethylamine methyltransferase family protein [Bacillota bacterium]